MMTQNERKVYKDIVQMCQNKLEHCKREYEEYEQDCRNDSSLIPDYLIHLDGEIMAYQDVIYKIVNILGGDK